MGDVTTCYIAEGGTAKVFADRAPLPGCGTFGWYAVKRVDASPSAAYIKREKDTLDEIARCSATPQGRLHAGAHHIVRKVFDTCSDGRHVYFSLEMCAYGDLVRLVDNHGDFVRCNWKRFAMQILLGLDYLHNVMEYSHGDIKCENILVYDHFWLKIADFGFSQPVKPMQPAPHTNLSWAYASPEKFLACYGEPPIKGTQVPYDERKSDIWAFGIVLHVLCTSMLPFTAHFPIGTEESKNTTNKTDLIRFFMHHRETALKSVDKEKSYGHYVELETWMMSRILRRVQNHSALRIVKAACCFKEGRRANVNELMTMLYSLAQPNHH